MRPGSILTAGIGASIARIFLGQSPDHNLVAIARTADALHSLKAEFGDRVAVLAMDIAQPETAAKAVEVAVEKFGAIDSIVANAGVLDPVNPVEKADVAKWKALFDVNLFAVVDLVQHALPHLKTSRGKIVAVLSGAATKPYYGWAAYGASKAALNHVVGSIALENADVSAISVAPGVVATEMQKDIRDKFGKNMTPESLQRFVDLHENGQLLHPDVPATVYVNLAVKGWPSSMDGQYYRVGEDALGDYATA